MEARLINDQRQWNEFIEGAVQCNVTQSYEWGQLLTTLDGEVLYVGVVDDGGKMCAAMLLLVSRVAVSNSVYFYAPRGPIIDNPESPAMTVLLNYVKALAHKYHAFMLKVEPGVNDNDMLWLTALHRRGFVANPEALHLRHEWVLDIRPDEQTLLAGMKKTWRYCVRLASRKDVTVRRGESLADIATFYNILQTTSQRDTFMIYDKSFYEKLVELYGKSGNVALFIAEYEGQALGAALLVKLGRWCWYMYGASSNEHRDRMPNHLLQWTAMHWAKEQGCWYYNFRGIPDVLEESQPMWGIYVFKSGFGGSAMRSLETHDLAYNPLLYKLYRGWLDGRSWLKDVRAKRHAKQIETEQQEKQNDGEQPKDAQQITQSTVEKPAMPDGVQVEAGSKPTLQKQPRQPSQHKQPKPPHIEQQRTMLPEPENPVEGKQEAVESPAALPELEKVIVEEKSETGNAEEPLQKGKASVVETAVTLPEMEQAVVINDADSADEKVEEGAVSLAEEPVKLPEVEKVVVEEESNATLSDEKEEAKSSATNLVELPELEQSTIEEKQDVDGSEQLKQGEVINVVDAPSMQKEDIQVLKEEKSDAGALDGKTQKEVTSVVEAAVVWPQVAQSIVEEKSDAGKLDEPTQEEVASVFDVLMAQLAFAQVVEEEREMSPVQESLLEPEYPITTEHKETEGQPVYRASTSIPAEDQEQPTAIVHEQVQEPHIQTEDTQKVRVPSFYSRPEFSAKQLEAQEPQNKHEDPSIHAETQVQPQREVQMQPVAEHLGGELRSEELQVQLEARAEQPELEASQAQVEESPFQLEHRAISVEPTEAKFVEAEHRDVQAEPEETKVKEAEYRDVQVEPAQAKAEETVAHVKTKAEEVVEELERRANVRRQANTRKQVEEELERPTSPSRRAEEDLEDQAMLNEETQKLPRVKMAQKYSRRPMGPNGTHDGANGKRDK